MKTLLKAAVLAATAITAPAILTAPAAAQAIKGIATADQERAALASAAYRNAQTARQTTYKPQIDAAIAERNALQTRVKPLVDKLTADSKLPNANQAALQTQYEAIQRQQQESEQRIQQIIQPLALSEAYVNEQIADQLDAAIKAAMAKKGATLLIDERTTISHAAGYDITADITTELNRLIPAAQITPPPGWLPRAQREQAARAAAAQAAPATGTAAPAAGTRPAAPAPVSR